MIQPRVVLTTGLWRELVVFFEGPKDYDVKALKRVWKGKTKSLLHAVLDLLSQSGEMSIDQLKSALKKIVEDSGLSLGALMGPLRVIIVGSLTGPDLFLLINTLGTREVIKRIQFALKVIK